VKTVRDMPKRPEKTLMFPRSKRNGFGVVRRSGCSELPRSPAAEGEARGAIYCGTIGAVACRSIRAPRLRVAPENRFSTAGRRGVLFPWSTDVEVRTWQRTAALDTASKASQHLNSSPN